jgi:hypothetical protein
MKSIGIALFALLLAAPALAEEPVSTTLAQLIAAPQDYAYREVRLVGQVDNCNAWACALCPAEMTNESLDEHQCLEMEFDGYWGEDSRARSSALLGEMFRFATVEIEASFDPCNMVRTRDNRLCLDRVIHLRDAHVRTIFSRKSALDGLVYWSEVETLSPAQGDERHAMWENFYADHAPWEREVRFFVVNPAHEADPDSGILARGLGCVCRQDSCDGHWPTRWFNGFASPANPFVCTKMEKHREGWRILNGGEPAEWGKNL